MSIQELFSRNMKSLRLREGLSQEQLAEMSGLHRTYIGSIEQKHSNVTLESLEKIAIALGVSPIDLLKEPFSSTNASDSSLACEVDDLEVLRCHYALGIWHEGKDPEFIPIDVHNVDLTLRILCVLVQEGYTEDLAKAYERVQDPIIDYLQSLKKSEYPKDYLFEILKEKEHRNTSE